MTVALALADAGIIGRWALDSLGQLFTSPWIIPVIAVAVAMGVAAWRLRRAARITHMVTLPPGGEIGDDVIAMIRQAREEDRTEAQADADYERAIDEMIEKWGLGG